MVSTTTAGSSSAEHVLDMPTPSIPLTRAFANGRELELVDEVLRNGSLRGGPMLHRFEDRFAHVAGVRHAVAVAGPVAALELVAATAGWGMGDEVVTSPFGSVDPDVLARVRGIASTVVDIDAETLGSDPTALHAAIGGRTRGVVAVDSFGWPADVQAIRGATADGQVVVVRDLGGALGASGADIVQLVTIDARSQVDVGTGAVLCCNDEQLAGAWRDLAARESLDVRLGDLAAAVGLAQLERFPRTVAMYELVADDYVRAFEHVDGIAVPCARRDGAVRSWARFWITLNDGGVRDHVHAFLGARGIESLLPRAIDAHHSQLPVAADVARRALALPCYPQLSPQDQQRVVAAVCDALDAR